MSNYKKKSDSVPSDYGWEVSDHLSNVENRGISIWSRNDTHRAWLGDKMIKI